MDESKEYTSDKDNILVLNDNFKIIKALIEGKIRGTVVTKSGNPLNTACSTLKDKNVFKMYTRPKVNNLFQAHTLFVIRNGYCLLVRITGNVKPSQIEPLLRSQFGLSPFDHISERSAANLLKSEQTTA